MCMRQTSLRLERASKTHLFQNLCKMQAKKEIQVETVQLDDNFIVLFSLKDGVSLSEALKVVEESNVQILGIISRPAKDANGCLEYLIEMNGPLPKEKQDQLLESIKTFAKEVSKQSYEVPWFPCKIKDIDVFANRVKHANADHDLQSDHPGFKDEVYRARRKEFGDIALKYRHGHIIPEAEYTEDEIKTWNTAFQELTKLYPTHACQEFNAIWPFLVEECNYRLGCVPQLQVVSDFLKERSGFALRPVAGLLSPRDFLAGLAFRVFHSTQYIRHGSKPLYTPEPDVVHELIGHVPLFADPEFADFSQEIGLASLGAPDEWIDKLSTLYWFTVEFGLCKEGDETKAYGAGLLSSFGELEYCMTDTSKKEPLDPEVAATTEYPITTYQPKYFVAESFTSARQKLKAFADKIPRPFSVRYNPLTQSVEVIKSNDDLKRFGKDLQTELGSFMNAFYRMQ